MFYAALRIEPGLHEGQASTLPTVMPSLRKSQQENELDTFCAVSLDRFQSPQPPRRQGFSGYIQLS